MLMMTRGIRRVGMDMACGSVATRTRMKVKQSKVMEGSTVAVKLKIMVQ